MAEFEIDFLEDYSQPALIAELQRIQKLIRGRPITKADIDRYGRASWRVYFRRFGSFSRAMMAAGLRPSRMPTHTENAELLAAVIDLWTRVLEREGRRPFASSLKQAPAKRIREEPSIRKRFLVFKRDEFTCVLCRRSGTGIKLEIDHKVPVLFPM